MASVNYFPQGTYLFREIDSAYFAQQAAIEPNRGLSIGFIAILHNGQVGFLCGVSCGMAWNVPYGEGGNMTGVGQMEWNIDTFENTLEMRCNEETVINGTISSPACQPGWEVKYYTLM